jgi:hypothetical protein
MFLLYEGKQKVKRKLQTFNYKKQNISRGLGGGFRILKKAFL